MEVLGRMLIPGFELEILLIAQLLLDISASRLASLRSSFNANLSQGRLGSGSVARIPNAKVFNQTGEYPTTHPAPTTPHPVTATLVYIGGI